MKKLVLASGSPRRKRLLEQIGLDFTVEPSRIVESFSETDPPAETVERLSAEKAREVAGRLSGAIIIGADSLVAFRGRAIGKPKDAEAAKTMLCELSGETHEIVTGFTVVDSNSGVSVTESVRSRVHFRDLGEEEIDRYVVSGEPLDKAGGYGIQEKGVLLVESIQGDYSNVVGLPLPALARVLTSFGIYVT